MMHDNGIRDYLTANAALERPNEFKFIKQFNYYSGDGLKAQFRKLKYSLSVTSNNK